MGEPLVKSEGPAEAASLPRTGDSPKLVVVTPAHNEAAHLPDLIQSIVAQDHRPACWVIVNDASDDATSELAHEAARSHDFIRVLDRTRQGGHSLSAKAEAVNAGYAAAVSEVPDAEFFASTDADMEFPPHTFSALLKRLADNPRLGVAGGVYYHMVKGRMQAGRGSPTHVSGSLQMFRRPVFDAIGGYQPLLYGAIDVISTASARLRGWETRAFDDLRFVHRRRTGTGDESSMIKVNYDDGVRDYSIGSSFLFVAAKCVRRLGDDPKILGSLARLAGFVVSVVTRRHSNVDPEVKAFIRAEQLDRLPLVRLLRRRHDSEPAVDVELIDEGGHA
jgi:hypothetical protein